MLDHLPFLLPLAIKIVATCALVVGSLAAAERVGPFWCALIMALPVSVGPTYVILALDHDAQFLARSALEGAAGNAAIGLYLIAYVRIAPERGVVVSLAGSIAVWAIAALLIGSAVWSPATAALANLAAFGVGAWSTRRIAVSGGALGKRRKRWFETPGRALLIGLLIVFVTGISREIGPRATGLIAMFPIVSVSMAAFLHSRSGGRAVAPIMASTILTVPSLAVGLLVLALTVEPWGKVASLCAALVTMLAWPLGLVALRSCRRNRQASMVAS